MIESKAECMKIFGGAARSLERSSSSLGSKNFATQPPEDYFPTKWISILCLLR
ncbi:unnamed protein product, partial [Sphenostylis stenocarpa]